MIDDLKQLWRTRRSSGFPLPFRWGMHGNWLSYITGHSRFSTVPLWKQMLGIPARPYRYARMVRNIAKARNLPYTPLDYDNVP